MMNQYKDIINLERPKSKYPKMSKEQRAAQFAPFAALTGYEGHIKEVGRYTESKIEIDEEQKNKLDEIFKIIELKEQVNVKITYFEKDQLKQGGEYKEITGVISKIDRILSQIRINNITIKLTDILEIDIIKKEI